MSIQRDIMTTIALRKKDNPIHAKELSEMFGLSKAGNNRALRQVVLELIELGMPIGSNQNGYFIIREREDFLVAYNKLKGVALSYFHRAKALRKAYYQTYGIKRRKK